MAADTAGEDAALVALRAGTATRSTPPSPRWGASTPAGTTWTGPRSSPDVAPTASICRRTRSSASGTGWTRPPHAGDAAELGREAADHPLLGAAVELPTRAACCSPDGCPCVTHPWLADHAVNGHGAAAGHGLRGDWPLRAGDEVGGGLLEELTWRRRSSCPSRAASRFRSPLSRPTSEAAGSVTVRSDRYGADEPWTRHAERRARRRPGDGVVRPVPSGRRRAPRRSERRGPVRRPAPPPGSPTVRCSRAYGPRGGAARSCSPRSRYPRTPAADGFGLHPALLDAALHGLALGARCRPPSADAAVLLVAAWPCTPSARPRCGCAWRRPPATRCRWTWPTPTDGPSRRSVR